MTLSWSDITATEHDTGKCNWRELLSDMDKIRINRANMNADPDSRLIIRLIEVLDVFQENVNLQPKKKGKAK
jgi:tRNA A37 N6-isopentenylltransferase MiaA